MNKIYNYIAIVALAILLGFSSCEKGFLDTKIDNYQTPETIKTNRGTLSSFANAFYSSIQNGFIALDGNLFAAATDEAQQTRSSRSALIFNQGILNANNNPDETNFHRLYEGIRAANFYLDYSVNGREFLALNRDTMADPQGYSRDVEGLNWYRGEARIAKAYYYAELAKRYGGVPIIKQTMDKATDLYVPKSSYEDVVQHIVSEIDTYVDSLQVNWKTHSWAGNQDGRFSQGSALALKSRVLLYAASPLHNTANDLEKWKKAAKAAYDVIALNRYSLHGDYRAYFLGSATLTSNETIMAYRTANSNSLEIANYPISTPGGNSGITPSHNLVAAYEYTGAADPSNPYANRDPRLSASIVVNGSNWNSRIINQSAGGSDDMAKTNTSRTGYYLKKFLTDNLNLVQGGTASHHWVLFRYAETLLNYAEAMNEAYGPDNSNGYSLTARQALKLVRDRSSTSLPAVTTTSVNEFRAAVKHERRIELAFEDHRYWDLLRWKDAQEVLSRPIQGVEVSKSPDGSFNYQIINVTSRTFSPAMYYFPFSQAELVRSNGTLVQNPSY